MNQHPVYRFDDFVVDPATWRLSRGAQEIHLEPVVLNLLIYLISHRDRLVTRQELMDTVWGDTVISEAALSQAVARLRKTLGDNTATPRYVETVHSKGYRFIAEVQENGVPDFADPSAPKPRWTTRHRFLIAAVALVLLVLLAVSWIGVPRKDKQVRSVAVLPLSNLTGDPEQAYYAEGLQDILITELSQFPGLRVTSRQSTRRYRDSDLAAADIAAELGVDVLVEGSLLSKGDGIEITVQLIDGHDDTHLWAEQYSSDSPHVFDLVSEIAWSIGSQIGPTQSSVFQASAGTQIDTIDPQVIDAYALGIAHLDRFTRDGIQTAIGQFEKAVEIEPRFALGWGQLAAAHAMQALHGFSPPRESIEKARAASLKAIEADEQFYIGHSTLGWTRLWTGDLDGACESFQAALRLNPSAPYALHGDADCLMLDGRMEESVARARELLAVGPFSAMHNRILPYHLFLARRFDEAIEEASAMQARVPQFSMHWLFFQVYWQQGLLDKALEEQRNELAWRNDRVLLTALKEGFDAYGPRGAMRAMAEALIDRATETYADPFRIAEAFARAGMVDEALQWLEKAVDYGSYEITYIAFQPDFDGLRDDPRFQNLLRRVYGERARKISRVADAHRLEMQ
jgi:TolB-like protein/DNA-binding winged helix-turn-helix (wHTH) protein/tetratricopeptide (TPR) repeat protein